jgi:hypothetical protein
MREESDSSASALEVLLMTQNIIKRSGQFIISDGELNALMKDCEFPEEPKVEQSEKKGYGGW